MPKIGISELPPNTPTAPASYCTYGLFTNYLLSCVLLTSLVSYLLSFLLIYSHNIFPYLLAYFLTYLTYRLTHSLTYLLTCLLSLSRFFRLPTYLPAHLTYRPFSRLCTTGRFFFQHKRKGNNKTTKPTTLANNPHHRVHLLHLRHLLRLSPTAPTALAPYCTCGTCRTG